MASTRIHIDEARLGRVQKQDRFATGVLTAIVAIVMLIVISMVAYILFEGISTLFKPGFLTEPSRANGIQGGVFYQLFDSFYLLLITLVISVPISLGGAVFLVEYAPNGPIRDIASTAIETLSSLPSIVVGMFGFLVFSVQLGWKYSIISGAVALTMFNIPILVRVIQQALEDVPQAQRDACLAMGLTRWEATLHILIPEAMPAIVTGIVLSAGRVFGEAAALLFTSGMSSPVRLNFLSFNLSSPTCAWNVFRPGESLAVHIYKIYGEGSPEAQQIVWGTAALLMICVLLFNVVARIVGKQLARKMTADERDECNARNRSGIVRHPGLLVERGREREARARERQGRERRGRALHQGRQRVLWRPPCTAQYVARLPQGRDHGAHWAFGLR